MGCLRSPGPSLCGVDRARKPGLTRLPVDDVEMRVVDRGRPPRLSPAPSARRTERGRAPSEPVIAAVRKGWSPAFTSTTLLTRPDPPLGSCDSNVTYLKTIVRCRNLGADQRVLALGCRAVSDATIRPCLARIVHEAVRPRLVG